MNGTVIVFRDCPICLWQNAGDGKGDEQQHGIFDTTAQQAYMENTEAYEQLFLDAEKYRIIQQVLAEQLYRELHGDSK